MAALKSALREDPDAILVGEMRDLETIRLAMSGAETGHLVFGTLHTSSAAKTIDRIVDVFPADEKDRQPADPLASGGSRIKFPRRTLPDDALGAQIPEQTKNRGRMQVESFRKIPQGRKGVLQLAGHGDDLLAGNAGGSGRLAGHEGRVAASLSICNKNVICNNSGCG
jgi:hypothetical protein